MTIEFRIPTELEAVTDTLDMRRLLVAKEWERAAIVFAFTEVGGPRNSRQPEPPKVNIRQFAALGFTGLTTPKAVLRYRRAWSWAIEQGLAAPVEPGDTVVLPEVPFPGWMEVMPEYVENEVVDETTYFQANNALASQLYSIRRQLTKCLVWARQMHPEQRLAALDLMDGVETVVARLREELADA